MDTNCHTLEKPTDIHLFAWLQLLYTWLPDNFFNPDTDSKKI